MGIYIDLDSPSNPLNRAGANVSINFNSKRRIVNTLASHKLVEWAKLKQSQNQFQNQQQSLHEQVIEEIFKCYFEQAKDLNSIELLNQIATKFSIQQNFDDFLNSNEQTEKIIGEFRNYVSEYSISGVPFFIFHHPTTNKKKTFSGAQSPHFFESIIEWCLT
eukprot:TRINITY_DN836_c0_g1_i1.p1 TRINITY_DN836_c0_g1~~TRINITY_DN836_c0_g1_i1.p1  ORF type:complete len:162 (-),score=69.54 TRINITY_DN836_c0_g1_i1:221-706(-)